MGVIPVPEERKIGRMPLPIQYMVAFMTDDQGAKYVVLELATAAGETTYFMSLEQADELSDAIHKCANKGHAAPHLIVPGVQIDALDLPPSDGQPN